MALPPRRPKAAKRDSRWRCPAHLSFVRSFQCAWPGCKRVPIEAAHVRIGSGAGMSQKPDDHRAVPLCGHDSEFIGHHAQQHNIGEKSFWRAYEQTAGQTVEQLIDSLCKASPRAAQIRAAKQERGL